MIRFRPRFIYSVILCRGRTVDAAMLDAWLGTAWRRPVGVA